MAVLSDSDRAAVHQRLMELLSTDREAIAITKAELRAAVDAIDSFLETNANAINNAFPTAARNGLTVAQKARLLCYVTLKRWGGGAT